MGIGITCRHIKLECRHYIPESPLTVTHWLRPLPGSRSAHGCLLGCRDPKGGSSTSVAPARLHPQVSPLELIDERAGVDPREGAHSSTPLRRLSFRCRQVPFHSSPGLHGPCRYFMFSPVGENTSKSSFMKIKRALSNNVPFTSSWFLR